MQKHFFSEMQAHVEVSHLDPSITASLIAPVLLSINQTSQTPFFMVPQEQNMAAWQTNCANALNMLWRHGGQASVMSQLGRLSSVATTALMYRQFLNPIIMYVLHDGGSIFCMPYLQMVISWCLSGRLTCSLRLDQDYCLEEQSSSLEACTTSSAKAAINLTDTVC